MDEIERVYTELFGEPQFMMFVDELYESFRHNQFALLQIRIR